MIAQPKHNYTPKKEELVLSKKNEERMRMIANAVIDKLFEDHKNRVLRFDK